ncbi:hypothetical protein [Kitasatospora sp. GAS206B]|uniref:hypothetical protein n=1 Tax=unclassified Kitasatospora TaxID=2633591 RepID=UPI0035187A9D
MDQVPDEDDSRPLRRPRMLEAITQTLSAGLPVSFRKGWRAKGTATGPQDTGRDIPGGSGDFPGEESAAPSTEQETAGGTGEPEGPFAEPTVGEGPTAPAQLRMSERRKFLDQRGFYEPRCRSIKTTTRQAEALNIAIAGPPSSPRGLFVGQDVISGQMVVHDVFQAYEDNVISSPNYVVLGDVGKGKSSLLKTWAVLRPLILAGRRAVVIDKKLQRWPDGSRSGENTMLARFLGSEPVIFRIGGGGSCINPLDPRIASLVDEEDEEGNVPAGQEERPAGQSMLLRTIMHRALDRPLSPREGKALREAHRAALTSGLNGGYEPTLKDVYLALLHPSQQAADHAVTSVAELREWGRDSAYEMERLISDDLSGLIDGPTSSDVRLDSRLTVFDLSLLPEEGPSLSIVMTIINTWLSNLLANEQGRWQTHFVVEEGWHLVTGPTAKVFQRNWKLARGLGLSNGVAIHHPSDIDPLSPAIALLKEAETVFIYGQARQDDALECVRLFGLPHTALDTIRQLPQGVCLLKIGSRPPLLVRHLRSSIESELTNTDSGMFQRLAPGEPPPEEDSA